MSSDFVPSPDMLVRSGFDDSAVRRASLWGELVRLAPGRYLRAEHWNALDPSGRHVMQSIAAVEYARTPVVVSHASAAAFWELPRLGPWPDRVHAIERDRGAATGGASLLRHAATLDDADVVERNGVLVTSPERTALDIALSAPLRQAVLALDAGLRSELFSADSLLESLAKRGEPRGAVKARKAIAFADARSASPGESLSRVVIHESRLELPKLQHRFTSPTGEVAFVDFFWESQGIVGEFDGAPKYRAGDVRGDLSPEDVVIAEKHREDWLRALPEVKGFVRWTWTDAFEPGRLARLLLSAGVPREPGVRAPGASRAQR
jgi:hypothetical protein